MRFVFHTLLALCPAAVLAAPLQIQFLAVDGKPVNAAVVTLRSVDASRPPARPVSGTIGQDELAFIPHVLVVPVGSAVSFPNNDKVSHQVYSFSPARSFKLPLYRGPTPGISTPGSCCWRRMSARTVLPPATMTSPRARPRNIHPRPGPAKAARPSPWPGRGSWAGTWKWSPNGCAWTAATTCGRCWVRRRRQWNTACRWPGGCRSDGSNLRQDPLLPGGGSFRCRRRLGDASACCWLVSCRPLLLHGFESICRLQ